ASHRSTYEAKDPTLCKMIHTLWTHASATALAANWLAGRLGFGKDVESEAFVGGLLHDVGKLVILRAIDEIQTEKASLLVFSQALLDEILATAHTTLGYTFLRHWDVPEVYCEIARDHHLQEFDQSKIPLVSVRLADHAGSKIGLSLNPNPSIILSALPEAQCLNAGEILLAELEIMMEDSLAPTTP